MKGFFSPKGLLLAGGIIILTGLGLNHFSGMKGEMFLVAGEAKSLIAESNLNSTQDTSRKTLGLIITLDSLKIRQYIPEFEILAFRSDTSSQKIGSTHGKLIDRFPADTMKIRKVGDTDYHFRLRAVYPNFQFAYEYPSNRDTIKPVAPGITLELKTKEGTPIVTLRTDQPNKNKLDDIVSLGAPLYFFWEKSADSVNGMVNSEGKKENKIVFSGADQRIYFIHNDTLTEQPLREGVFYSMPGQDTEGFTVLYSFPDYAYLKAVPSTKDTLMLNPVAHIEVWKAGEGYRDAFIYPERRGRKGGEYAIPDADYRLGLGEIRDKALRYCDCFLSIQGDSKKTSKSLNLMSGKSGMYKGYRFTPIECKEGSLNTVSIRIVKNPGKTLKIIGFTILLLAFSYMLFKRSHPIK